MLTKKIKLALILCVAALSAFALIPSAAQGQQSKPTLTAPYAASQASVNYERFTHQSHTGTVKVPGTNQAHELKCDSCHDQRDLMKNLVPTTDHNKQLSLKFPGHKACVECHIQQFTAKPQQTCTICHETKQGLTARPPQRDFARRYDFNAFFDARQHELHVKYNLPSGQKSDCSFCHAQTAKPAVLNIASHPECYACHSPTSGDAKAAQKSGCIVCHTQTVASAQPFSAKYVSRAYGALFTHKTHVEYVKGNCYECHTINGAYNQNSPASLKVKQHVTPDQRGGKGCFTCHDGGVHQGRTVFSGEYGAAGSASCNRCHTREDGKVFPSSGK
ncbi:MAG: cytochrome c3 family protein [Blastocatellia bacterium]